MFQASLRYGIQKAMESDVEPEELCNTVGQQIEYMLDESEDPQVTAQIRQALRDPQATIEVKSGSQIQTATPNMPLRELLPPNSENIEITVSQPHAGG